MTDPQRDDQFIEQALALAARAESEGEVPVGALIVMDGKVIGEGWNRPRSQNDPTAHAEMIAIRAAASTIGNYRLGGATLYVTLEPCPMCAGAMVHARVSRVVFGAPDPIAGAAGSVFNLLQAPTLNHRAEVCGGVLADQCGDRLRKFFVDRRTR